MRGSLRLDHAVSVAGAAPPVTVFVVLHAILIGRMDIEAARAVIDAGADRMGSEARGAVSRHIAGVVSAGGGDCGHIVLCGLCGLYHQSRHSRIASHFGRLTGDVDFGRNGVGLSIIYRNTVAVLTDKFTACNGEVQFRAVLELLAVRTLSIRIHMAVHLGGEQQCGSLGRIAAIHRRLILILAIAGDGAAGNVDRAHLRLNACAASNLRISADIQCALHGPVDCAELLGFELRISTNRDRSTGRTLIIAGDRETRCLHSAAGNRQTGGCRVTVIIVRIVEKANRSRRVWVSFIIVYNLAQRPNRSISDPDNSRMRFNCQNRTIGGGLKSVAKRS